MQLTVRMPNEYTKKLDNLSKKMGLKRSDIVRLALKQFLEEDHERNSRTPFQKVKHLLGIVESGTKDLGQLYRRYLLQKIRKGTR